MQALLPATNIHELSPCWQECPHHFSALTNGLPMHAGGS